MQVVLKEINSWHFVKCLRPFETTGNVTEAKAFTHSEARRLLYLYGLDYNYEIYEL